MTLEHDITDLRKRAERLGYRIVKSRSERVSADDFGEYRLIDAAENFVIAGSRYDPDASDLAGWLDWLEESEHADE